MHISIRNIAKKAKVLPEAGMKILAKRVDLIAIEQTFCNAQGNLAIENDTFCSI
jgi:hypothetical protein